MVHAAMGAWAGGVAVGMCCTFTCAGQMICGGSLLRLAMLVRGGHACMRGAGAVNLGPVALGARLDLGFGWVGMWVALKQSSPLGAGLVGVEGFVSALP